MEPINERVAQLIKALGHNHTSFGEVIGKPQSSVAVIANGRSKPGFEFLELICKAFPEVSRDWLLVGEGEMYRQQDNLPSKAADGGSFGEEVLGKLSQSFEDTRRLFESELRVFEEELRAKNQQIAFLQRMLEGALPGKLNDVTSDRSVLRIHPATERLAFALVEQA